ncbi:MAG TPA: hypothetical protein VGO67_04400 [Verrucomicrobiae bacterium]
MLGLLRSWVAGKDTALRDHVALRNSQHEILTAQVRDLELRLKKTESERDALKTLNENLKVQLQDAHDEIQALESIRKNLKDQTQLETEIFRCNHAIRDLEAQLRIKSIGF